jgi:hypothetical protein
MSDTPLYTVVTRREGDDSGAVLDDVAAAALVLRGDPAEVLAEPLQAGQPGRFRAVVYVYPQLGQALVQWDGSGYPADQLAVTAMSEVLARAGAIAGLANAMLPAGGAR